MIPGRTYRPTSGDEARWRALAEYAFQVGSGTAHGVVKLRELRDAARKAVILGADGEGNLCRRLVEVVGQRTDPRFGGDPAVLDELARIAGEVLKRCDGFRALREAERRA